MAGVRYLAALVYFAYYFKQLVLLLLPSTLCHFISYILLLSSATLAIIWALNLGTKSTKRNVSLLIKIIWRYLYLSSYLNLKLSSCDQLSFIKLTRGKRKLNWIIWSCILGIFFWFKKQLKERKRKKFEE